MSPHPTRLPSACATVARLIGVNDRPMVGLVASGPWRFSGPGWYALREPDAPITVVLWADIEDEAFIRLSIGRTEPARAYLSHRAFDFACVGRVFTVAEIEGRRCAEGRPN